MTGRAPVVVIGVGNRMRTDDGVGRRAVELLEHHPARTGRTDLVALDGEPTRLIDEWRGRRLAVVVDAALSGAEPGTRSRLEMGTDPLPLAASPSSSHGAGLAQAISLGEALDLLPERLVVFTVELADVSYGARLSPSVEAALGLLVDQIAAEAFA